MLEPIEDTPLLVSRSREISKPSIPTSRGLTAGSRDRPKEMVRVKSEKNYSPTLLRLCCDVMGEILNYLPEDDCKTVCATSFEFNESWYAGRLIERTIRDVLRPYQAIQRQDRYGTMFAMSSISLTPLDKVALPSRALLRLFEHTERLDEHDIGKLRELSVKFERLQNEMMASRARASFWMAPAGHCLMKVATGLIVMGWVFIFMLTKSPYCTEMVNNGTQTSNATNITQVKSGEIQSRCSYILVSYLLLNGIIASFWLGMGKYAYSVSWRSNLTKPPITPSALQLALQAIVEFKSTLDDKLSVFDEDEPVPQLGVGWGSL
ncbi:MAG: hypothetical protein NTW08_07715 [Gammaproteobacteria bacterium]|nr:hypothetical protein [Gammaproteobacteria bacterium]